jgi:hypothetical protein
MGIAEVESAWREYIAALEDALQQLMNEPFGPIGVAGCRFNSWSYGTQMSAPIDLQ